MEKSNTKRDLSTLRIGFSEDTALDSGCLAVSSEMQRGKSFQVPIWHCQHV